MQSETKKKTMYEITGDFQALKSLVASFEDENGDYREPTDEESKILLCWFHDNKNDFETKAENICKLVKNLQLDAETVAGEKGAFYEEHKRLVRREKAYENQAARVKWILHEALWARQQKQYKGHLFSATIQDTAKSYKLAPSTSVVPIEYRKNELDTSAIKKDVESGRLRVDDSGFVIDMSNNRIGVVYSGGQTLVIR